MEILRIGGLLFLLLTLVASLVVSVVDSTNTASKFWALVVIIALWMIHMAAQTGTIY